MNSPDQPEDWIHRWWPLPTSMELVRGEIAAVAEALQSEVQRYCGGEEITGQWVQVGGMEDVFALPKVFTNVPTLLAAVPTQSDWVVVWDNSFLCSGYDSLCYNFTRLYGFRTIHWSASQRDGPFQEGVSFTHRLKVGEGMQERSVYCARNDRKWEFHQVGEALPEEDTARYSSRRIKDRLREADLLALLAQWGARPRSADFYKADQAFVVRRPNYPATITDRRLEEVCGRPGE